MNATYITATDDNTAGQLGGQNVDIRIYRIIVGNPTDGAVVDIYNNFNAAANSNDNLAAKLTQPTAAAGVNNVNVYDFGPEGLPLGNGGNVVQNTTNQALTVIWDRVED